MLCASTFLQCLLMGWEGMGSWRWMADASSDWVLYISMPLWWPVFPQRLVLSGWRLSMRAVQPWTLAKARQLGSEPDSWDQTVNLPLYVFGCDEDPRNTHRASHAVAVVSMAFSMAVLLFGCGLCAFLGSVVGEKKLLFEIDC